MSAHLQPLRLVSFLAPELDWLYAAIAQRMARALGRPVDYRAGGDYDELRDADAAFICSLAWLELGSAFDAVAAPVLRDARYRGEPVYFSDVVVHRDHPARCFADLRGASWSFNEPLSQSGYGVTRHHLLQLGETRGFFGRVVKAGFHRESIRLVARSEIDASAIDSHLLDYLRGAEPAAVASLRVIDLLGPSTIQPLVASRALAGETREAIARAATTMHADDAGRASLSRALIDRFVAVGNADYDDVRAMRDRCHRESFGELR